MKNLKVIMLAFLVATGLAGCGNNGPKECEVHTDNNHDGVCEVCGKTGLEVKHVDENPKDHKCDVCGKVLSDCADANKDHKCDYCGKVLSECADNDKDHKCDVCGKVLSQCADADKDHKCDYCGKVLSECKDANKDHMCDYCGKELTQCVDEDPKDHICDICGKVLGDHVDNNHDGKCEYCGKEGLPVHHKDEDGDGKCDVCKIDIVCTSYTVSTSDAVKNYARGEALNTDGIKVVGKFNDDTEKDIEFYIKPENMPDMSKVGEQDVVISFVINGIELSRAYTINISDWSKESLEVFEQASLFAYDQGAYPFMLGLEATGSFDEDEYLLDWSFSKANGTMDDVNKYWEIFSHYNHVAQIENDYGEFDEVTFKPIELVPETYEYEGEETIAEHYNLVQDSLRLFKVVPYYTTVDEEDETSYDQRYFTVDEYVLFGLDKTTGEFKGYNRFVNAMLDGYIAGADDLYLTYWTSKEITSIIFEAPNDLPGYYYSEAASLVMPYAELSDGYAMLTSLTSINPFDYELDEYSFAFRADAINGSASDEAALRDNLVKLGYVVDPENPNRYTLENEVIGKIIYNITPFAEDHFTQLIGEPMNFQDSDTELDVTIDAGFAYSVYYAAPAGYTYLSDLYMLDVAKFYIGEIGAEFTGHEVEGEFIYGQLYEMDYNGYDIFVYPTADEVPVSVDPETLANFIISKLPDGFIIQNYSYESKYGCYIFDSTNKQYYIEAQVYEADENGIVEVVFFIGDDTPISKQIVDLLNYYLFEDYAVVNEYIKYCDYGFVAPIVGVDDPSQIENVAKAYDAMLFEIFGDQIVKLYFGAPGDGSYVGMYYLAGSTLTITFSYNPSLGVVVADFEAVDPVDPLTAIFLFADSLGSMIEKSIYPFVIDYSNYVFGLETEICAIEDKTYGEDAKEVLSYFTESLLNLGYIKDDGQIYEDTDSYYLYALTFDSYTEVCVAVEVKDGKYNLSIITMEHIPTDPIELGNKFAGILSTNVQVNNDGSYGFELDSSKTADELVDEIYANRPDFVHFEVYAPIGSTTYYAAFSADDQNVCIEFCFNEVYDKVATPVADQTELDALRGLTNVYVKVGEEFEIVEPDALWDESTVYYVEELIKTEVFMNSFYNPFGGYSTTNYFGNVVNDLFLAGAGNVQDKSTGTIVTANGDFENKDECNGYINAILAQLGSDGITAFVQNGDVKELDNGYSVELLSADGSKKIVLKAVVTDDDSADITFTVTEVKK